MCSVTKRNVIWISCVSVVALAVLVFVGLMVGSNWATFWPDAIIGLFGAGLIATVVAAVQLNAEARRGQADKVTAAYERLFEAFAPLRISNLRHDHAGDELSVAMTKMAVLSETVDDKGLEAWFEAERKLGLLKASESDARLKAVPNGDAPSLGDARFNARAPFNSWAAAFADNLRLWRAGRMSFEQMSKRTAEVGVLLTESHG